MLTSLVPVTPLGTVENGLQEWIDLYRMRGIRQTFEGAVPPFSTERPVLEPQLDEGQFVAKTKRDGLYAPTGADHHASRAEERDRGKRGLRVVSAGPAVGLIATGPA